MAEAAEMAVRREFSQSMSEFTNRAAIVSKQCFSG